MAALRRGCGAFSAAVIRAADDLAAVATLPRACVLADVIV